MPKVRIGVRAQRHAVHSVRCAANRNLWDANMTTLTPARLTQMIEAAKLATPGPWHLDGPYVTVPRDTADHISACDPQTIIALCRIALAAKEYMDEDDKSDFDLVKAHRAFEDALREAGLI